MSKPTRIIIPRTGIAAGKNLPRAIYDERSVKVLSAIGRTESMRASHVDAGKDMSQSALHVLYARQDGPRCARKVSEQTYEILPEFAESFFADLTPCGADVVLGPYHPADREGALRDEVAWLQAHNVPTCAACTAMNTPPDVSE